MGVVICLLRGVNLGGHRKVPMADLRSLCAALKLDDAQTCLQSGNVVFRTRERDLDTLARRIEDGLERKFGFRPDVMLRTTAELRDVVAGNPFAARKGLEPAKLAVVFLARDPGQEAREAALRIKATPEELRVGVRELYIYFPNGMARPNLSPAQLEKALKTPGTARNWNTTRKLLEIAEKMEA
jgi:uncharacterized protein (DUF1697 family)